jgi:hypothetical protein
MPLSLLKYLGNQLAELSPQQLSKVLEVVCDKWWGEYGVDVEIIQRIQDLQQELEKERKTK